MDLEILTPEIAVGIAVAAGERGSRRRWFSGWQVLKIEMYVSVFAPGLSSRGLCAGDTVPKQTGLLRPFSLLTR